MVQINVVNGDGDTLACDDCDDLESLLSVGCLQWMTMNGADRHVQFRHDTKIVYNTNK